MKRAAQNERAPGDDAVRRTKADLRRAYLDRRRAMDVAARAALSHAIAMRLFDLAPWTEAAVVHLYVGAVEGEVETRAIALDALASGKRIACPRVAADPPRLEHYQIRSLDELVETPRGLWEPDPTRATLVDPAALDLILVPGIAFDRLGGRLGFGAGYYDRFLAGLPTLKVGLAFSLQIADRVPQSPRDVPVDWIVTESETIACRANREAAERETETSEARR